MSPNCDLDFEVSKPIFSQDTPAHHDVPPDHFGYKRLTTSKEIIWTKEDTQADRCKDGQMIPITLTPPPPLNHVTMCVEGGCKEKGGGGGEEEERKNIWRMWSRRSSRKEDKFPTWNSWSVAPPPPPPPKKKKMKQKTTHTHIQTKLVYTADQTSESLDNLQFT